MASLHDIKIYVQAQRRNLTVAAFAVLVLGVGVYGFVVHEVAAPEEFSDNESGEVVSESLSLVSALPMTIRIPKISVEAVFEEPVGLESSGEIGTPEGYETVSYYKYGPMPGSLGPAVVLGHVDSYKGPAVFYSLGQLREGDEIFIDREDGETAVFKVTELVRAAQTDFPTAKVYGDLSYAGLRLITCSGIYNHGSLRYSHNLIVFAELVGTSTVSVGD